MTSKQLIITLVEINGVQEVEVRYIGKWSTAEKLHALNQAEIIAHREHKEDWRDR